MVDFGEVTVRPPVTLSVTIPGELVPETLQASMRYGGNDLEIDRAAIRKLLVDALARELRALGYYGSGSDKWYGSPMHSIRK